MDSFLYDEALGSRDSSRPFLDKQVLHVQDMNGGNYSNQITFDTTSLGRDGRWMAWSEAYLEIPFTIKLRASEDISGAANAFMVGLKNGYYQIIDSIQCTYTNTSVVQQMFFTNFFTSFKVMTSFSKKDLKKWGPSLGIYPDSAGSYVYRDYTDEVKNDFTPVPSPGGDGYSNNRDFEVRNNFAQPEIVNEGFLTRKSQTTAYPYAGYSAIPPPNAVNTAKNIYQVDIPNAGAQQNNIYNWYILATIRLKDIADFFDQVPILKGGFIKLKVFFNSAINQILVNDNEAKMAMDTPANNGAFQVSGNTNPILLSNIAANNSAAGVVINGAADTIRIASSVGGGNPLLSSCRLYVPSFSMEPEIEKQILSLVPSKQISYLDIYCHTFSGVGDTQDFNELIHNGLPGVKYLVMMPFVNPGAAGQNSRNSVYVNVAIPQYQSPFDTAPATTAPISIIYNFNVQIGGANVLQNNYLYDFQTFMDEIASINAISGARNTGLTNGLIGQYEWDNAYRYYVVDLSRRLPINDTTPQPIRVSGNNRSGKTLDFVVFLVYEKKVTFDMHTGGIADGWNL